MVISIKIALVVLHCASSVVWGCAPNDLDADSLFDEIDKLASDLADDIESQIDAVKESRIADLVTNPEALLNASYNGEVIVTLTSDQEQLVIDTHPGFFMEGDEPPFFDPAPSVGNDRQRRQLPATGSQKCMPNARWVSITLALNHLDKLVQVIQTSNSKQWVIDEQCESDNDPSNDPCRRVSKLVPAYVIDLQTYANTVEYIQVFSCITFNSP